MFIADVFVITPKRKQLKRPSIDEWVNRLLHPQHEIPLSNKKDKLLIHAII